MKAAFACWDNRIAPVFDTARRIHTVEVKSERIVKEGKEILPDDQPVQKALRLAEMGVGTLVCGAISRQLHAMVSAHGIRVIPFVAGELDEIVKAWLGGNLRGDSFAMPGCRGPGPRRFRGTCFMTKEGRDMPGNRNGGRGAGGGRGQGRGQRRGQAMGQETGKGRGQDTGGNGPAGPSGTTEPAGTCMCYQCGYREPHELGLPCRAKVCPRCGGKMGRES